VSDLKIVLVFRPEACAEPMNAHAHNPFDGIEVLAKLPSDQVDPYVNRKKMHNPIWSFLVVDDMEWEV
jgi:hypothetical protein